MATARDRHYYTPVPVYPFVYSSGDPGGRHAVNSLLARPFKSPWTAMSPGRPLRSPW
ncbi:MAG TPA: hypothetical protein VKR83_13775 [Ktedonobacteraceae bacterium]|nr:hypothetical protein [Ktedonobacteraceae bacterium]